MQESRHTFFRQSGWLAIANTLSGVFLMAVYSVISPKVGEEISIYATVLRFFALLAIPASGLQIVMAQEAAAAVTPEERARLARTARSVLFAVFLLWGIIALTLDFLQVRLITAFQMTSVAQLWLTIFLVLAALFLPALQGLLQGTQNFLWLGWSTMFNGAGRFAAIVVFAGLFSGGATGALLGALVGLGSAVALAWFAARPALRTGHAPGASTEWMKRVIPLGLGGGAVLFLMTADMLFVQSHFPSGDAQFYAAPAVMGVGLVTFTTPMAAVMFPKMARSFSLSQSSNALQLALVGTAVLGGAGALVCTIWPELPFRVMFFNKPEFLKSVPLLPWFMWGLVPLTLANVLVSNLLARRVFTAVPWLALVAIGYGFALHRVVNRVQTLEPLLAFKQIVQTLAAFSLLLFLVSAIFTAIDLKRKA